MCGSIPVAIAFSEYALVWIAVATLSHGVLRKFPPNASCGAHAIACRNPSSRPHRDPISAATASICAGSFASISSTSTGFGSRRADFSVSPIARPNDVRTTSAPRSCRACADAYAIDSRVSTPVTSSFFPSSSICPHAMCTRVDLKAAPKVDLHRHLEGAIRLGTLLDLYREHGRALPESSQAELAPRAQVLEPMASLEDVLSRFTVAQGAFFDEAACERIAFEAVEDLAADNGRLAELRFSPGFLCEPHDLDWDAAMAAIARGAERAAGEHDVTVGLIAIASRNYGLGSAERTAEFAWRHRDRLVAFDLAGDEKAHPPAMFVDVVAGLDGSGLHLTTHYGEAGGAEFPREAVEALHAERLGHGVSVAEDPSVVALVRERDVTLEMCPTSNRRTRAVPSLEEHPARRLLDQDVSVTINTDNPGLFAVDLTNELEVCVAKLGFSDDDLRQVTANAIDASFVDDEEKAAVRRRHFGWVDV